MPELIEENEVDSLTLEKKPPVVKNPRNYIDDDHLSAILSDWKRLYDANIAAGKERPRLPEAVGEAISDMADKMGNRVNFHNYSYLEEMKSDGILHCVKYIHNFDPNKKSDKKGKVSAFGYINMILWNSFTNRIKYEKHQQYLKYKSFEVMGGADAFQDEDMADMTGDDGSGISIGALASDFMAKIAEYEEKYEADKKPRKEKKNKPDTFMFDMMEPQEKTEEESEFPELEFEIE